MKYYYAARIEADGGATEIDGAQVVLAEDYDRLWEELSALTAAARKEATYDDVLHRRLWLYIERAEKVLQDGEDD